MTKQGNTIITSYMSILNPSCSLPSRPQVHVQVYKAKPFSDLANTNCFTHSDLLTLHQHNQYDINHLPCIKYIKP